MPSLVRGSLHAIVHHARNLPENETVKSKIGNFFKEMFGQERKEDFMGVHVSVSTLPPSSYGTKVN